MRATKAWQKVTSAFKKPFQKLFTKTPERPEPGEAFFRESGESVYYQKKGVRKHRKRRKRMENKSRAINYLELLIIVKTKKDEKSRRQSNLEKVPSLKRSGEKNR